MSDVQRWTMQHLVGKVGLVLDADSEGEWVTYADHLEALRQAEQDAVLAIRAEARAVDELEQELTKAREQGQRDERDKWLAAMQPAVPAVTASIEAVAEMVKAIQRDALAAAVQRVEATWASSWCGLRYPTCDDPDHACRYRREVIAAIRGEQA